MYRLLRSFSLLKPKYYFVPFNSYHSFPKRSPSYFLPFTLNAIRGSVSHLPSTSFSLKFLSSQASSVVAMPSTLSVSSVPFNKNFKLDSAQELKAATDQIIEKTLSIYNQIASLPLDQCNFENVFSQLAFAENQFKAETEAIQFMKYVSSDKEVREASQVATQKLDDFEIENSMRKDIYEAMCAAFKHISTQPLSQEDRRFVDRVMMEAKRNGLALPDVEREKLKSLRKKIAQYCTEFSCNKNKDETFLLFSKEDLEGLPSDYFTSLTLVDGKYKVTMSYPDRLPILRKAKKEDTRRLIHQTSCLMCPENVNLLNQLVPLRHEAANALGYPTHAAFVLEPKMAKTSDQVQQFLLDLKTKLTPLGKNEYQLLLDLKNKERASQGLSPVSELYVWDFQYYHTMLMEKEYNVNQDAIKPFFSIEAVTQGMLQLYSKLLDITITKSDKVETWHPDVTVYQVYDTPTQTYLGTFFLDLFPRDGTYKHAAVFTLRPSYQLPNQSYETPICAMKANFTKPTSTTPSLLKHDEVVTYFHELGHVMHCILSKTKYARFHGTSVARDFVEAPSQMFENWCWEPSVLQDLSSHYSDQSKLPDSMIQAIVKSQHVNEALHQLRQLHFGLFDLHIHTHASVDTTTIFNQFRDEITLFKAPKDTFGQATFDHLTGGYDAGYYGYLWSKVFSSDMYFSKFLKEGISNPKVGRQFRDFVLYPGGSKDEMELIEAFLGRKPNSDAFLKSIGLKC